MLKWRIRAHRHLVPAYAATAAGAVIALSGQIAHGVSLLQDGEDIEVTIREIVNDYSVGYHTGVKQPLGAFRDGLSVHQISRSDFETGEPPYMGTPDFLLWMNDDTDTFGLVENPTGRSYPLVPNPGGMVSFDADGYIWYTLGARVQDLPPSLFRSQAPGDVFHFDAVLDDYVTKPDGSTAFMLHAEDRFLHMFWRSRNSRNTRAALRHRRYDRDTGFEQPDMERDLGSGELHETFDRIGIEQLFSRFDPRWQRLFVTWQWFDVDPGRFGSYPYIYSDDHGSTWRRADGSAVENSTLPLRFSDRDDLLVPFDHIGAGKDSYWFVRDIGTAPDGTNWIQMPNALYRISHFWYEPADETWHANQLTNVLVNAAHAGGPTKDYLVFVYANFLEPELLLLRTSLDGGRTWTEPVVIDELVRNGQDGDRRFVWVSFIQPSEGYPDNTARFFYGYSRDRDGGFGERFANNIRYLRIDLPDPSVDAVIENATIIRGTLLSGDAESLMDSDDVTMAARSAFGFLSTQPNVLELRVDATAASGSGTSLDIAIESRANNPQGVATVQLRNWATTQLDAVGSYAISISDTVETIADIDTAEYIRAGDSALELRVRHVIIATFSTSGFVSAFDQVRIAIRP
ncbi:MAG: hypothetical protein ACR2GY_00965 [Phycisphaerales bacterium]